MQLENVGTSPIRPHDDHDDDDDAVIPKTAKVSKIDERICAHDLSSCAHNRIAQNHLKSDQIEFKIIQINQLRATPSTTSNNMAKAT